jgi:serine/threonine protein kinase
LIDEATAMAQIALHPNLVSLVGVISKGLPKMLLVSYCEHGSLQGLLRARAKELSPFTLAEKYKAVVEIAAGMAHLTTCHFVHRDLAARNVLVATGTVCKVASANFHILHSAVVTVERGSPVARNVLVPVPLPSVRVRAICDMSRTSPFMFDFLWQVTVNRWQGDDTYSLKE